jgi:hypothetical protein
MRFLTVVALLLAGCFGGAAENDCARPCQTYQTCPSGMSCRNGYCRSPNATGACASASDGGATTVTSSLCAAGQIDVQPCGKCGTRSRNCNGAGAWGPYGACKD